MRCPFCQERTHPERNPLRFSGAHVLGCSLCYTTKTLKLARSVRPALRRFTLYPDKGAA